MPTACSRLHLRHQILLWTAVLPLLAIGCGQDQSQSPLVEGQFLLQEGKSEEAIQTLTSAIDAGPESPVLYYYRGRAREATGDLEEACQDYRTSLELNDRLQSARPSPQLMDRRSLLFATDLAEIFTRLGTIHLGAGEYDDAIKEFTKAIEVDPQLGIAYCRRGIAFLEKGLVGIALDDLTAAIDRESDLSQAYCHRARAHLQNGETRQAVEDCHTSIRLAPQYALAYETLGHTHLTQGADSLASRYFDEAVRLDGSSKQRIESLWQANEGIVTDIHQTFSPPKDAAVPEPELPGNAVDSSDQAEDSPTLSAGFDERIRLGYEALKDKDYVEAVRELTRVLESDPRNVESRYGRGLAFLERGFPDTAIEDLTKAIIWQPSHGDAYFARARAHVLTGRYSHAIRDCTEVILLQPENAQAYYLRGQARLELKRIGLATADLGEAQRLDPELAADVQKALVPIARDSTADVEGSYGRENYFEPRGR